ncbi:MAG: hypothetical protein LUG56_10920 [Lachnospiraceae bacterium]|nr:hypothetical protein [Lachnospiraceae bacterium]
MVLIAGFSLTGGEHFLKKGSLIMENLILFVNSFLSYLFVFVVSIVVAGVGAFAGYKLRVRKNLKDAQAKEQEQDSDKK